MPQSFTIDGTDVHFPDDASPAEIQDFLDREVNSKQPKTSAAGAAGRGALTSLLPTGAAVGTATALEAAAAPESFGASLLLIPPTLGVGWLAGKLQQKAIHKFAPGFEQLQAADIQQHAWPTTFGSVAAGLPFAQVQPGAILSGRTLVPASIGAGIGAVQPLVERRKPTVQDIVGGFAAGGLYGPGRFRPTTREVPNASSIREAAQIHGNVQAQPGEGAGQVPIQEGGRGILTPEESQKTEVLLKPVLENNRSLGLGHNLEVYPSFGAGDPNHVEVFRAMPLNPDGTPGRIRMSETAFYKWWNSVPQELRPQALQAAVAEEGIHSMISVEEAQAYLKTLTPAEVALGKRLYLGDQKIELSPAQLGQELLRQRMQRVLRMTPTELAEVTGREKWGRASLEFISNLIRRIREFIGTKAATAGREMTDRIFDRFQENLAAAKGEKLEAAAYQDAQGQTHYGSNHPEITDRLGISQFYPDRESRNVRAFGYKTNLRPFVPREDAGPIAKAAGQQLEDFEVGPNGKQLPHSDETASATNPAQPMGSTPLAADTPFMIRRKEDAPELIAGDRLVTIEKPDGSRYLAAYGDKDYDLTQFGRGKIPSIGKPVNGKWSHGMLAPGEKLVDDGGKAAFEAEQPAMIRRKAQDKEAQKLRLPTVRGFGTGSQISSEAASYLKTVSDPSFNRFFKAAKKKFPGLGKGHIAELWDESVGKHITEVPGEQLKKMADDLGIETPERIADPLDLKQPAASGEARTAQVAAQRSRQRIARKVYERLVEPAYSGAKVLKDKVSPEDLAYSADETKQPVIWTVTNRDLKNPAQLAVKLTQDSRRRMTDPVSVTKRLTLLQDNTTHKAYLVSTYPHGRSGAMMVDPAISSVRAHRPLAQIMRRYRPVGSFLLDEPVQNFRQEFENLADFEHRFGTDARTAFNTPLAEIPEGAREAPEAPSLFAQRNKPITEPEAAGIYQHIVSEAGDITGPEDVKASLIALNEDVKANRAPAAAAMSGYLKLATALEEKQPGLSDQNFLDTLAQQIYDTHKNAKTYKERIARTMEQGSTADRGMVAPEIQRVQTASRRAGEQARFAQTLNPPKTLPEALAQLGAKTPEELAQPAMINRFWQATKEEGEQFRKDISEAVKRGMLRSTIPALLDAADGVGNNRARQLEVGIRILSTMRPRGVTQYLSDWRHGDRDTLAAAKVLVEAGGVRDNGTIDTAAVTQAIPQFRNFVVQGRAFAQNLLRQGTFRSRKLGNAMLRTADQYDREIDYAEAHLSDPDLQKVASRAAADLQAIGQNEIALGYNVMLDPRYVPHRWDAQLWDGRSVIFRTLSDAETKILGKNFRQPKTFRTHYEALANGPFIPVTADIASLVGHRARQSFRMINNDLWWDGLKGLTMPNGRPVALEPKTVKLPGGGSSFVSPEAQYTYIPNGRAKGVAVHDDYAGLVQDLTQPTWFREGTVRHRILTLEQQLKHTLLVGDVFHLGRVFYYGLATMGKNFGWHGGSSVLDIARGDEAEAVRRGFVRPEDVAWANARVRWGNQQITRRDLAGRLQASGLNVGRIQDALYKDLVTVLDPSAGPIRRGVVRALDPSIGRYNRFLFDKFTRGLMMETAVKEFERQHKAAPNVDPERLSRDIAKDVNVFFGNLGRQGWFKSQTGADMARMFLLAPQWVEGLLRKEGTFAGRVAMAPARAMGVGGRQGLPNAGLGTIGKGIGQGLLAMLLLTQGINLISRKKPTWENEEKGHKFDAWIPGFGADEAGFWLSPLALFNEITHDLYRLVQDKPTWMDALDQIAGNKESPLVRAARVAIGGHSPTGTYLSSSGSRLGTALEQLAPSPISFGRMAREAGHAVAPGLVDPNLPGQFQRQLYSTAGIKVEPRKNALQEVQSMVREFIRASGKQDMTHFEPTDLPSYSRLRMAVRNNDKQDAWKMLDKLRAGGHDDDHIIRAMEEWAVRPFTGSKELEDEFRYSLDEHGRQVLSEAEFQKLSELEKFKDFLVSQPH